MKISGSVNLIIVSALSHYIIYMYFLISVRSATCACVVENPEYLYFGDIFMQVEGPKFREDCSSVRSPRLPRLIAVTSMNTAFTRELERLVVAQVSVAQFSFSLKNSSS